MANDSKMCTTCGGSGQVLVKEKDRHENIYKTCPTCKGSGETR